MTEQRNLKLPTGYANLKESDGARQQFYAIVHDKNTELEDVLEPSYWAHHANRFVVGGGSGFPEVTLVWEDGSRYLRLIVLGTGHLSAVVKVLEDKRLDDQQTAEISRENPDVPFLYAWKGPTKRHCVIRAKDKEIVKDGFATKEAADKEIAEMNRASAA